MEQRTPSLGFIISNTKDVASEKIERAIEEYYKKYSIKIGVEIPDAIMHYDMFVDNYELKGILEYQHTLAKFVVTEKEVFRLVVSFDGHSYQLEIIWNN
jgi:hypothetical protein